MTKKSPLLLLVLLLFSSQIISSGDFPILERQVEIRKEHGSFLFSIVEKGMEGVIEYVDKISVGEGTSKLEELLDDFQKESDKFESLTTNTDLNNEMKNLEGIVGDFRTETLERLDEHDGELTSLVGYVKNVLEEDINEIEELREIYWETRETNTLEIFDIYMERARTVFELLEGGGYDTTEGLEKLGELEGKKAELRKALRERDNTRLIQVNKQILSLSEELVEMVRYLQVGEKKTSWIEFWIDVSAKVLERTNTLISELEVLKIDVEELEELQSKIETNLETTKNQFDEGDLDESIEALLHLKTYLVELGKAFEALIVREDLTVNMEDKIELTVQGLNLTAQKIEDSS